MNLTDIRQSQWDQRSFWRTYGSMFIALMFTCALITLANLSRQEKRSLSRVQAKKEALFAGQANNKLDRDLV